MRTPPRFVGLLLPFLTVATSSSAQEKFEGYYIRQNGDTARGHVVNYRQWTHNPSTIEFFEGNKTIQLHPGNVRAVHIYGYDTYIPYTGKRLVNPTEMKVSFNTDSTASYKDVSTFLRQLFSNDGAKLLLYHDATRLNFYYQFNDTAFKELIYKVHVDDYSLKHDRRYQQQLLVDFSQQIFQNDLKDKLDKLEYREKDLVTFFESLFGKPVTTVNKVRYRSLLLVGAAISVSSFINSTSPVYPDATTGTFDASVNPAATIAARFYHQRTFGKLYISPLASFYTFKQSAAVNTSEGKGTTIISGLIVNPNVTIGYHFVNEPQLKLGLSGGAGIMFTLKDKINLTTGPGGTRDIEFAITKKKLKYNWLVQLNADINRLNVMASYARQTRPNDGYAPHARFQVGAAWIFRL